MLKNILCTSMVMICSPVNKKEHKKNINYFFTNKAYDFCMENEGQNKTLLDFEHETDPAERMEKAERVGSELRRDFIEFVEEARLEHPILKRHDIITHAHVDPLIDPHAVFIRVGNRSHPFGHNRSPDTHPNLTYADGYGSFIIHMDGDAIGDLLQYAQKMNEYEQVINQKSYELATPVEGTEELSRSAELIHNCTITNAPAYEPDGFSNNPRIVYPVCHFTDGDEGAGGTPIPGNNFSDLENETSPGRESAENQGGENVRTSSSFYSTLPEDRCIEIINRQKSSQPLDIYIQSLEESFRNGKWPNGEALDEEDSIQMDEIITQAKLKSTYLRFQEAIQNINEETSGNLNISDEQIAFTQGGRIYLRIPEGPHTLGSINEPGGHRNLARRGTEEFFSVDTKGDPEGDLLEFSKNVTLPAPASTEAPQQTKPIMPESTPPKPF